MIERGWFVDQRVEFVEGNVIDMWPISSGHSFCISAVLAVLQSAFGSNFWVRPQMPMDCSPRSFVIPDLLVLTGSLQSHRTSAAPTTGQLVIEVSESSLAFDRDYKASLYALQGVPEYWSVAVVGRGRCRRCPGVAGSTQGCEPDKFDLDVAIDSYYVPASLPSLAINGSEELNVDRYGT